MPIELKALYVRIFPKSVLSCIYWKIAFCRIKPLRETHFDHIDFSNEQLRIILDARQAYETWVEAERELAAMPYNLQWKSIGGNHYLYSIRDRHGNGTSLGRRAPETEQQHLEFHGAKATLKARIADLKSRLDEIGRMYEALRLPLMPIEAGPILREADIRGLLGADLMVIGTNAMASYQLEARCSYNIPLQTLDFDFLATSKKLALSGSKPIWDMLKAVDSTFTVNTERPFQARNSKAYEVEILSAPSRAANLSMTDQPRPVILPEQEWLLLGKPVSQVLFDRRLGPVRVYAPDPRYFALLKTYIATKPERNINKIQKDRRQAEILFRAIAEKMPHYPIGAEFRDGLAPDIAAVFDTCLEDGLITEDDMRPRPRW